jgi:hypothetical protein
MARVNFTVGDVVVAAEFNSSETAWRILEALPLESSGSYWGGEFYFPVPVKVPAEKDAHQVVEPGTVAYWPSGACLCIFWGPTPASLSNECRAASEVNLVGRVLNPEVLPTLKGRKVRVATPPTPR